MRAVLRDHDVLNADIIAIVDEVRLKARGNQMRRESMSRKEAEDRLESRKAASGGGGGAEEDGASEADSDLPSLASGSETSESDNEAGASKPRVPNGYILYCKAMHAQIRQDPDIHPSEIMGTLGAMWKVRCAAIPTLVLE